MIVSWSRTAYPPHPSLTLCGTSSEEYKHLVLLGVTLDSKLTFEKHIRQMAASISQKIGIVRKCYRTLGRSEAINKAFFAYVLPCFILRRKFISWDISSIRHQLSFALLNINVTLQIKNFEILLNVLEGLKKN